LALSTGVCQSGQGRGYTGFGMPIYEYRCDNGHTFDVLQKFTDEALTECEVCGAPARRVLHPAAIHFKGSGFYSTDYGRGKKKAGAADGKGEGSSGDSSSGDGGKQDAKTESKPEPKKAAEA
jgi:putative FmdB family regulatory protein